MKAEAINNARNITALIIHGGDPRGALREALKRHGDHEIANGQVEIRCDREFLDSLALKKGEDARLVARQDDTHFSHDFDGAPLRVLSE